MSAAAPTTPATALPVDLNDRQGELGRRSATALKAQALKLGIEIPDGVKSKADLVGHFAKDDAFMAAYGWAIESTPTGTNGDVDADGQIEGATPAAPGTVPAEPTYKLTPDVNVDDDGFPDDRDDVVKLNADHLVYLRWCLVTQGIAANPGALNETELAAWVAREGYQVPGQEAIPVEGVTNAIPANVSGEHTRQDAAHTPTAAPEPRTETLTEEQLAAHPARATAEDGETEVPEPAQATPQIGQLSLIPGGEKPAVAYLNIGALRIDLGGKTEFARGDRITVTFEADVEKIAFAPEKSGDDEKRVMRTHGAKADIATVAVELVS